LQEGKKRGALEIHERLNPNTNQTMKKHIVFAMVLLSAVACKESTVEPEYTPDLSNVDPLIRELRLKRDFRTVIEGSAEWDSLRGALAAKTQIGDTNPPQTTSGPTVVEHLYYHSSTSTYTDYVDGDGKLVAVEPALARFNTGDQFRQDNPMEAIVLPDMMNRPDSVHVITGVAAKASGETFQAWWIRARKINGDGSLGSVRVFNSTGAPSPSEADATVLLPPNSSSTLVYVAAGVGVRIHNKVNNLGLYMVPYNPATKSLVINSVNDVIVLLPQETATPLTSFERQIRIWDCTSNLEHMKRMIVSGFGGRNNNNSITRIGIKISNLAY
jgi:hypothetical protein